MTNEEIIEAFLLRPNGQQFDDLLRIFDEDLKQGCFLLNGALQKAPEGNRDAFWMEHGWSFFAFILSKSIEKDFNDSNLEELLIGFSKHGSCKEITMALTEYFSSKRLSELESEEDKFRISGRELLIICRLIRNVAERSQKATLVSTCTDLLQRAVDYLQPFDNDFECFRIIAETLFKLEPTDNAVKLSLISHMYRLGPMERDLQALLDATTKPIISQVLKILEQDQAAEKSLSVIGAGIMLVNQKAYITLRPEQCVECIEQLLIHTGFGKDSDFYAEHGAELADLTLRNLASGTPLGCNSLMNPYLQRLKNAIIYKMCNSPNPKSRLRMTRLYGNYVDLFEEQVQVIDFMHSSDQVQYLNFKVYSLQFLKQKFIAGNAFRRQIGEILERFLLQERNEPDMIGVTNFHLQALNLIHSLLCQVNVRKTNLIKIFNSYFAKLDDFLRMKRVEANNQISQDASDDKKIMLSETRVLVVSNYLPVTLVIDNHPNFIASEINRRLNQRTDSLFATAPPSRYHFRSDSSDPVLERLPFTPTKRPGPNKPSYFPQSLQQHVRQKSGSTGTNSPPRVHLSEGRWMIDQSFLGNIGLYKAAESIRTSVKDLVYIGQLGASTEQLSDENREEISAKLRRDHHCVPVYVSNAEVEGHYTHFCKEILWPTMHYILPESSKSTINETEAWNYYVSVNKKYADIIAEEYQDGDVIWIHDYHLFLVPSLVREKLPKAVIGFFLHIPFPSSEVFRCLHVRKELLEGLLGANLVGFQTYPFARHFLQTCTRLLGHEGTPKGVILDDSTVAVGIFPIGIDTPVLNAQRQQQSVREMITKLEEKYQGKRVIVARDKLDPVKGVRQKFLAFELFLTRYPQWQGKVVLVQVALSTTDHPELQRQVSELASRINSRFGTIEYTPVVYLHQDISFSHYLALLTIADACLITSLRDGMNLTSHEYVACQQIRQSPLILSEFTGTYGSFGAAIRINPWNYREVADAVNEALCMSTEEKSRCHNELYRHVISNTGAYWATSLLQETVKVAFDVQRRFSINVPHLDCEQFAEDCSRYKKVYIFSNLDGTLVPYEKSPQEVISHERLVSKVLSRLSSKEQFQMYIVSGRSKSKLSSMDGVGMSAENGAFIKLPGSSEWKMMIENSEPAWHTKVLEIFEYYTERTPGSFIEKKETSLVWHFRTADPTYGLWQAKELQNHLSDSLENNLQITSILGKKYIEVRPKAASKGSFVIKVLSESNDPALVLGLIDDRSDEDLFDALEWFKETHPKSSTIACIVGSRSSKADKFLTGPAEVIKLLERLAS